MTRGLRDGRHLRLVAIDVTLILLTGPYLSKVIGTGPVVADATLRPWTPQDLIERAMRDEAEGLPVLGAPAQEELDRRVASVDVEAMLGRIRGRLGRERLLDELRYGTPSRTKDGT